MRLVSPTTCVASNINSFKLSSHLKNKMGDTLARQEKKEEQTDTISGHPFHPCGHGKYHNLDYEGKKMP